MNWQKRQTFFKIDKTRKVKAIFVWIGQFQKRSRNKVILMSRVDCTCMRYVSLFYTNLVTQKLSIFYLINISQSVCNTKQAYVETISKLLFELRYLCVFPSVCLSAKKNFRPKWIKFANSVNRHLEFQNSSPKGLKASQYIIKCLYFF